MQWFQKALGDRIFCLKSHVGDARVYPICLQISLNDSLDGSLLWTNQYFVILSLCGEGVTICRSQYVPHSKNQSSAYYRHHLSSNNVAKNTSAPSTLAWNSSTSHHHSSSFSSNSMCTFNNAQLDPKYGIVMVWSPGSHLAFSFFNTIKDSLWRRMGDKYHATEWALFPNTAFYTRTFNNTKLSTSGAKIQVTLLPFDVKLQHTMMAHSVVITSFPFGKAKQGTWVMLWWHT